MEGKVEELLKVLGLPGYLIATLESDEVSDDVKWAIYCFGIEKRRQENETKKKMIELEATKKKLEQILSREPKIYRSRVNEEFEMMKKKLKNCEKKLWTANQERTILRQKIKKI